jgi:hypothetical protein
MLLPISFPIVDMAIAITPTRKIKNIYKHMIFHSRKEGKTKRKK